MTRAARRRGWSQIPLVSGFKSPFQADYKCQEPENDDMQWPVMHVFAKRDGKFFHFWATETSANHVDTVFYGCGIGIESIAQGALPLALFGAEGYGARMGRLAMPSLVAMALAPYLGAVLMQHGGASLTLSVLIILAAVNVCLVLVLRAMVQRPAAT